MNIAVVCNLSLNKPEAVIGIDSTSGNIGFISKNLELENILNIIIDRELNSFIEENINGKKLLRKNNIKYDNVNYLNTLSYYLPYPWKILTVKGIEGNLEDSILESYEYMEGLV